MLAVSDENEYQTHKTTCVPRNHRYYPGDDYNLQVPEAGDRIGLLVDTVKRVGHLFFNGQHMKEIFKIEEEVKYDKPWTVVVCMACGRNSMRINNDAIWPNF
jgi:hypothetical protein